MKKISPSLVNARIVYIIFVFCLVIAWGGIVGVVDAITGDIKNENKEERLYASI